MRHDVTTPSYLFRKAIDNVLEALTSSSPAPRHHTTVNGNNPSAELTYTAPACEDEESAFVSEPFGWLPLYSMVTFQPRLGYAAARRKAQTQGWVLKGLESTLIVGAAAAVGWAVWLARSKRS
jgi:kynurenine 3-monooxygenase